MVISEPKYFVLQGASFFFEMRFSKRTKDQDESFQGRTPHIHCKKPFFSIDWYQISMPKVSPFHSRVKMNQQRIHLFIPLQAINQRNVNSQISHPKLPHVCEREKMKIAYYWW